MNTILFSLAGILFLIGISFLFSYFSYRRGTKWEERMDQIRKATFKRRNNPLKS